MPRGDDRRSRLLAAAVLPLALLACSRGGGDDPGTVSADEAAQLNDAAAMLDANSVDSNAVAVADPRDRVSSDTPTSEQSDPAR